LSSQTLRRFVAPGWPTSLPVERLNAMTVETPFLVCDLDTVGRRYRELSEALPGAEVFYAVKCNPAGPLLSTIADHGGSFEIASLGELHLAEAAGVPASRLLYSNPVKPPGHIAGAFAAGLRRFSFDSPSELQKLAALAPGADVYARLRVTDENSMFPLSKKFGMTVDRAVELLTCARDLGLRPYGLTFHVGSQCTNAMAWDHAIEACRNVMVRLRRRRITLTMLDLGGGFPARYTSDVPSVDLIGSIARRALERLPYQPEVLAVEPGRFLVAESGVLATSVIGLDERDGERWVYLDAGGYNGLMETVQAGGRWPFPLRTSGDEPARVRRIPMTVTGPSCDSSDTMFYGIDLPETLALGDRVYIGSAGAYSVAYASTFNGFAVPAEHFVGAGSVARLADPVPEHAGAIPALVGLAS
jgi:ornithine decarboxylase